MASVMSGVLSPALAQSARQAEIVGFHQLCEKGDRRACVHFGILIGENRALHAEWHRLHPELVVGALRATRKKGGRLTAAHGFGSPGASSPNVDQ
jgi:hypothetical protein